MTTAGDLDRRVRFDKKVEVDNPGGGTSSSWVTQFDRAADIINQKGGEGVQAQRLTGVQPAIIVVRFDNQTRTIKTDWRAVEILNGVPVAYYAIKTAADMEGERKYWSMQAIAGDPDGGIGPA